MLFIIKTKWLYLILVLLFTSTTEAQRAKSLDVYFLDVEKSAKKLSYSLDNLKNYMNEIDKPNSFISKTFFNRKPRWYFKFGGWGGDVEFELSTNFKLNDKFKKRIDTLLLKSEETQMNHSSLILEHEYLNSLLKGTSAYKQSRKKASLYLKEQGLTTANIQLALNSFEQSKNKVQFLIEKYEYAKLANLFSNIYLRDTDGSYSPVALHEIYNHIPSKHKNNYINNDIDIFREFFTKIDNRFMLDMSVDRTSFRIVNRSKSDLYNKEYTFISIFDELEQKGLCKKLLKNDRYLKCESLNNRGRYKSSVYYNLKTHYGVWSTQMGNSDNDLREILSLVEQSHKKFVELVKDYMDEVLNKTIEDYILQSSHQGRF